MKNLIITIFLLLGINSFGQDKSQDTIKAIEEFKKLSDEFKKVDELNTKENEALVKLKNEINATSNSSEINAKLEKQLKENQKYIKKLDSIYSLYTSYKTYHLDKKTLTEKTIDSVFNHKYTLSEKVKSITQNENTNNYKTYLYFGKNQIIQDSLLFTKDKKVNEILQAVFSKESESYLGDIIIPKENQKFNFYRNDFGVSDTIYKFKSVSFELHDGFFTDIKVFVLDENGSEHLFENKASVSVLNYSHVAPKNYLFYKHPTNQKQIVKYDDYKNLRVRLSDVLMYTSKPGYNYIPNDFTMELPTKDDDGISLNANQPIKYEIKENTSLQNVLEFRAYTDFLGLFSDSPNGIVQFQGKGDFYIFPFRINNNRFDFRLLDKISPFVNFSRLDADVREVETTIETSTNTITVNRNLDLIQKAYLEMGSKISVFNVKFLKEAPFRVIGYMPIQYQIADIKINDEFKNIQAFVLGGGLNFEFKRFNNFGFNYSIDSSKYRFKNLNTIPNFEVPNNFSVFNNQAEIFYHPSDDKNQSVFLKLKTVKEIGNTDAFYQLQFGYRFSIGISKVKAKTN
ncbi:hypothetical protein [uncultured Polaribacter sp.]|uniref:hypothetical protein n=1 Tax=uncultured Polaribacter sp. TaxID=174711 RepID=UPI0030D9039C|tara:strand:- start:13372 stop:15081 length:1710 start_codon:yes stop_codon:yes gene_type:complete